MTVLPMDNGLRLENGRKERPSVFVVDPSCCSLPYDYSLCEALTERGWAVTLERSRFIEGEFSRPCSFTVHEGFYSLTHRVPQWRGRAWRYTKALEHVVSTNSLLRRARRQRPSIIHYQWVMVPAADAKFLELMARVAPIVLTLHNTTVFHGAPSSRLQGLGFRSVFRSLDAVVVHAEYSKRRIVEAGWMSEERIHVIPHGALDYRQAATESAAAGSSPEDTILFFGRVVPYKGVDVLLKAFAALPATRRERTRVVIAGLAKMDVTPLRELAQSLDIASRVEWRLSFIDENDVPELFRAATVVALPYREVDQSGVLLTALAFDKPVVATRIGGIPEAIQDGVHGLLTKPEDAASFAAALDSILSNAPRRRAMQQAVRSLRTGELAWSSIARKTIVLYEQLLQNRDGGLKRISWMSSDDAQAENTRAAS